MTPEIKCLQENAQAGQFKITFSQQLYVASALFSKKILKSEQYLGYRISVKF